MSRCGAARTGSRTSHPSLHHWQSKGRRSRTLSAARRPLDPVKVPPARTLACKCVYIAFLQLFIAFVQFCIAFYSCFIVVFHVFYNDLQVFCGCLLVSGGGGGGRAGGGREVFICFYMFYKFSTEELRLATGAGAPVARKKNKKVGTYSKYIGV